MDRREFLHKGAVVVGGATLIPGALTARTAHARGVPPSAIGDGPYGPLSTTPDANGLLLPVGFSSRIVAIGGEMVEGTAYTWPPRPDGAGTIASADGGWIYLCNSNLVAILPPRAGSASAIDFGPDGAVRNAYSLLTETQGNSGGCVTPWGTWLSCEDDVLTERGVVWECDPAGGASTARPALGLFGHLSVAVDPVEGRVYLTQSHPSGLLYRFTPSVAGDLSAGVLEACLVADDGSVSWAPVSDPTAQSAPMRDQVPGARVFPSGGGAVCAGGWLYFTSKGDNSVHGIELTSQRYRLIWKGSPDATGASDAVLSGGDALAVAARSGDLFVAEDGADGDVVIITADGQVSSFVRALGPEPIRITGPVFDPSGTRLYLSSQRATTPRALGEIVAGQSTTEFTAGVTYEITGPFRGEVVPAATTTVAPTTETPTSVPVTEPAPTTVPATAAPQTVPETTAVPTTIATSGGSGGSIVGLFAGGALAIALAGGYVLFRRFQSRPKDEPVESEVEQPEPEVVAPPPPVAPVPVVPMPVVESAAIVDPEPAPSFEDDEPHRPLLGTQLLDDQQDGPSSARTLYDRSEEQQAASARQRLELEEAERLATPVQWKSERMGSDDTADDDGDDDGDGDGDDAELDFFDDVVERDDGPDDAEPDDAGSDEASPDA
ncbi:MAG: alkaline phosphatase PhoX [Actinomycetota bacterium]